MVNKKILIVDDDENIAELLQLYIQKECFDTKVVYSGEDALNAYNSYKPDLVLLDIMLPGIDGYEVLRNIRKTDNTAVILLSAKGETFDKVLGLELGADDYIMKPFDNKEMIARVKAVLRRVNPAQTDTDSTRENKDMVSYPNLTINLGDYTVHFNNSLIEMPPKEIELLYFLASNPNQVFSREQLLDRIWSYDYVGDTRTVDVHIKRLREKFTDHPDWDIRTVWGVGYKFEYPREGK